MARPQETVKKREKEMKRREKREKKLQRRLDKKAQTQETDAPDPRDEIPHEDSGDQPHG